MSVAPPEKMSDLTPQVSYTHARARSGLAGTVPAHPQGTQPDSTYQASAAYQVATTLARAGVERVLSEQGSHLDESTILRLTPLLLPLARRSRPSPIPFQVSTARLSEPADREESRADSIARGQDLQETSGAVRSMDVDRLRQALREVRIHNNENAARSAEALDAHAYSFGIDIVFNRGCYAPDARHGLGLLAHEVAHVLESRSPGIVCRLPLVSHLPMPPVPPKGTEPQLALAGAALASFYAFAQGVPGLLAELSRYKTIAVATTSSGMLMWAANGNWAKPHKFFNETPEFPTWRMDVDADPYCPSSGDAEQRLIEGADEMAVTIKAMAVSRVPCASCVNELFHYGMAHGSVLVGVLPPPPEEAAKALEKAQEKEKGQEGKEGKRNAPQTSGVTATSTSAPTLTSTEGRAMGITQEDASFEVERLRERIHEIERLLGAFEGEHKILHDQIYTPSITGFVGYWVNHLNNRDIPPLLIWNEAHHNLLRAKRALAEMEPIEAALTLLAASRSVAAAIADFRGWKNGLDAAAIASEKQIAVAAMVAVGTFIAPSAVTRLIPASAMDAISSTIQAASKVLIGTGPAVAIP